MKENNNGHFGSGFLLGVIVGAAIVFFFGTKRGKEIFKLITEESSDYFSEILDDEEELYEEPQEPRSNGHATHDNGVHRVEVLSSVAPSHKRFFRGVPKKS